MRSRLDKILLDRGLAESRAKAAAYIMEGRVLVQGRPATKAGTLVRTDADVRLLDRPSYVSRGAYKLMAALDAFHIDVRGITAIDVGASTGGFTEVLLERGASRVYAVDVGRFQLHWRLRNDPRVVCLEGVNARYIGVEQVPEPCDMAVFDVSFISLRLVVGPVTKLLKRDARLVALVKPQFEAGRSQVGKGGLVRDEEVAKRVVEDMMSFMEGIGFETAGVIPSPVKGAKGNQEYLLYAVRKDEGQSS